MTPKHWYLSHLALVKPLKLKLSVYLHLHKRKHNVFKKIFYKNFVQPIFKMQLTKPARNFLNKSFLCFIGIRNLLNNRIKSVKKLNSTCKDLWPWLFEFRKLPSSSFYQTHCENLERWLNMLKDMNKYSSSTTKHHLTEDQINNMIVDFDAAYEELQIIVLESNENEFFTSHFRIVEINT